MKLNAVMIRPPLRKMEDQRDNEAGNGPKYIGHIPANIYNDLLHFCGGILNALIHIAWKMIRNE